MSSNRLKNFLYSWLKRFWSIQYLFVFMMILSIINIRLLIGYSRILVSCSALLGDFLISFFPSLIIALIKKNKLRYVVAVLWGLCFTLFFIYEYHLIKVCETPFTDTVLVNLLSHNSDEVNDMYFPFSISAESFLKSFFISIFAVFISFSWFPLCKYIVRNRKNHKFCIVIFFVFSVLSFMYFLLSINNIDYSTPLFYEGRTMFARDILAVKKTLIDNLSLNEITNKLLSNKFEIKSIKKRPVHNVVLIIGESLRRDDMHCYGYPLPNTPNIDSLAKSGNLFLYDDVASCAFNTDVALKSVLTYHRNDSPEEWYDYPTISSLFSSAGYHTYWCSNQEQKGYYVHSISAIAKTFQEVFYVNPSTASDSYNLWNGKSSYDDELIPKLKDYNDFGRSLFEVVHLMGSHPTFSNRYPSSYATFSSEDIKEDNLDIYEKELTAQYMNSVLFNDYVIKEIIDKYSTSSSIIVYFSDHGLRRYDDPDDTNMFSHASTEVSTRIPFMVYMSEQFVRENPDISEAVKRTIHNPIMTDVLCNSLVSLMGIESNLTDSKFDMWSNRYDITRPRKLKKWDGGILIVSPKR